MRLKGFEPLAHCLEGSCSIQLSYRRIFCTCWSRRCPGILISIVQEKHGRGEGKEQVKGERETEKEIPHSVDDISLPPFSFLCAVIPGQEPGSSPFQRLWTPASAGVTALRDSDSLRGDGFRNRHRGAGGAL